MSKVILISPSVAESVLSQLYGSQNTNSYNTGSGYPISSTAYSLNNNQTVPYSLNQISNNSQSNNQNVPHSLNQISNNSQPNAYSQNSQPNANQLNNAQSNGQLSTAYSLAQINNNPPLVRAINAQALANPVALPLPQPSGNLTVGQQMTEKRRPVGTYALSQLHPSIQIPLLSQNTVTSVGAPNTQLPDSFDARIKWPGLITGPLDQQQCGSCWAFSTATSFSDRLRISGKAGADLLGTFTYVVVPPGQVAPDGRPIPPESYTILNNVSAYQLVSCNRCGINGNNAALVPVCNRQCGGGVIPNAFQYLIIQGANTFTAINPVPPFPFDDSNPVLNDCQFTTQKPVYKGTAKIMVVLPGDSDEVREQKIKHEVYSNGPVSIGFTVFNSFYTFFEQNPRGIYSSAAQPLGDVQIGGHAVTITGWGIDNGLKYWVIRNSWGPRFGEGGFFRIQWNWRGSPNAQQTDSSGNSAIGILDEVWALG